MDPITPRFLRSCPEANPAQNDHPRKTAPHRSRSVEGVRSRRGHVGATAYVFLTDGSVISLRKALISWQTLQRVLLSLRDGLPTLICLPTHALHIHVKNNVRLVYLDRNDHNLTLTAKVALPSKVRSGSLAREVKIRKLITREGSLSAMIPALGLYDTKNATWIEEEYVKPQEGLGPARRCELFLTGHARQLYAPFV